MERHRRVDGNGCLNQSYIWAFEEGLLPYYNVEIYQQDNAPIHISAEQHNSSTNTRLGYWGVVLRMHRIWIPNEHFWARLKELAYDLRPELNDEPSTLRQVEVLHEVIARARKQVSQEYRDNLVETMPHRIEAWIAKSSWQPKY